MKRSRRWSIVGIRHSARRPGSSRCCASAAAALVSALIAVVACSERSALESESATELPNVLFVMIDTLRADRCTPYGYRFDTTPYLAELAKRGVLVRNAYAPSPTTSPSTASAFTSLEPRAHGVLNNGIPLDPKYLTVAELFHELGYQTAGFVSSIPLKGRHGFSQGFEFYLDQWSADEEAKPPIYGLGPKKPLPAASRRGHYTTADVLRWFDEQRDPSRKFFAFVHYYDPHEPYVRPPEELAPFAGDRVETGRDQGRRRALEVGYDAEVAYTDRELRRLIDGLERGGRLENTLIVLWADHGQGLLDHDFHGHGRQLYDEAVHVPLIVVWPERIPAGGVFEAPVELQDVVPTVLGLLQLEPADVPFEGRDLAPALLGQAEPDRGHPVYLQRRPLKGSPASRVEGPMWAVRAGGWKYIEALREGQWELYDLNRDPEEQNNLYAEQPQIAAELKRLLDAWVDRGVPEPAADTDDLPRAEREALEALGYVD